MDQTVSFSDFQKLDIRIGTVVEAVVPQSPTAPKFANILTKFNTYCDMIVI